MNVNCEFEVINYYQCSKGFTRVAKLEEHYLLYVHSGLGKVGIGEKIYDAAKGDIFYTPPNEKNIIFADEKTPYLLSGLIFRGDMCIEKMLSDKCNIGSEPVLYELIYKMIDEYLTLKQGYTEVCNLCLEALICLLFHKNIRQDNNFRKADRIIEYIQDNLTRNLTYADICKELNYHKNSINKYIKQATGMSFAEYYISLRINKACQLLSMSEKTIGEIAEECGYSSVHFFSRQFKQKTGITPSDYRRYIYHE